MKKSIKQLKWNAAFLKCAVNLLESHEAVLSADAQFVAPEQAAKYLKIMEADLKAILKFTPEEQAEVIIAEMRAFKIEMMKKHNIPAPPE